MSLLPLPQIGELPDRDPTVTGYVDGGGNWVRVVLFGPAPGGTRRVIFSQDFRTRRYPSLYELLADAFRQAGLVPSHLIFALAGCGNREKGEVSLTNAGHWSVFSLGTFETVTGCAGELRNDMEIQAADAACTLPELLRVVRDGHVWSAGRLLIITVSTGFGVGFAEGGKTFATELGHGPARPLTEDEDDFCRFAARRYDRTYAEIEDVVSGSKGDPAAVAWLMSRGLMPSDDLAQAMGELAAAGHDVGAAITKFARIDPFARRIVRAVGGLYGTALQNLMATMHPHGGVHLIGGMNRGSLELFMDPAASPFMDRLNDPHMPFADVTAGLAVYHNTDQNLATRGAKVLAGG